MDIIRVLIALSVVGITICLFSYIAYEILIQQPNENKFCQDNGFEAADRRNSVCYKISEDKLEDQEYRCPNKFGKCHMVKKEANE